MLWNVHHENVTIMFSSSLYTFNASILVSEKVFFGVVVLYRMSFLFTLEALDWILIASKEYQYCKGVPGLGTQD